MTLLAQLIGVIFFGASGPHLLARHVDTTEVAGLEFWHRRTLGLIDFFILLLSCKIVEESNQCGAGAVLDRPRYGQAELTISFAVIFARVFARATSWRATLETETNSHPFP